MYDCLYIESGRAISSNLANQAAIVKFRGRDIQL